jgi:hypothetical protein
LVMALRVVPPIPGAYKLAPSAAAARKPRCQRSISG